MRRRTVWKLATSFFLAGALAGGVLAEGTAFIVRGGPYLNPNNDEDYDRLTNGEEREHGTDPFNPDTDGDGFSDFDELHYTSNPLDPESIPVSWTLAGFEFTLLNAMDVQASQGSVISEEFTLLNGTPPPETNPGFVAAAEFSFLNTSNPAGKAPGAVAPDFSLLNTTDPLARQLHKVPFEFTLENREIP